MNKRTRFCQEYLKCWNATRAARAAGYSNPDKVGLKLLAQMSSSDILSEAMKAQEMTPPEIRTRLAQQARNNAADFFVFESCEFEMSEDGGPPATRLEMTGIDWAYFQRHGHLVKKLGWSRQGKPILEFYDAQRALELLGKDAGMFIERTENRNLNAEITADDLAKARDAAEQFERLLFDGQS